MSDFDYPDIIRLKQFSTDIISKTCTIKDINNMRKNLDHVNAVRPEIIVGSNKIRISPEEYYLLRNLLGACVAHLERDISNYNDEIRATFDSYGKEENSGDRDQSDSGSEVQRVPDI